MIFLKDVLTISVLNTILNNIRKYNLTQGGKQYDRRTGIREIAKAVQPTK